MGNLVLLYTCKRCLAYALEKVRESVCNSEEGVVQLELHEGYGADEVLRLDIVPVVEKGDQNDTDAGRIPF